NNGIFTDPGETGYASGTLKDGSVSIALPSLGATGPYAVRARVTDLAGNQATSGSQAFQVTSQATWSLSAQVLTSDPVTGDAQDQLGDVRVAVPLDLDRSPGTAQAGDPALVYNSDGVGVRPIIQAAVQTPNTGGLPMQLTAQLTWNGTAQG